MGEIDLWCSCITHWRFLHFLGDDWRSSVLSLFSPLQSEHPFSLLSGMPLCSCVSFQHHSWSFCFSNRVIRPVRINRNDRRVLIALYRFEGTDGVQTPFRSLRAVVVAQRHCWRRLRWSWSGCSVEVFRHCFWCDDINPIRNYAINRITDCWNQIPNKVLFQKDGAVVVFVIRTQHCINLILPDGSL